MRSLPTGLLLVAVLPSLAAAQGAPDLIVDEDSLAGNWAVVWRQFDPADCAVFEACVAGAGWRRLLVFETETANIAAYDLYMGPPETNPLYHYSTCHGHYHLEDYAEYELLDDLGSPVGFGHKQGFCLLDSARYLDEPWVPEDPFYSCDYQGIQRGWSDIYAKGLDCQWIDVTDVPGGSYTLRVTVNPERVFEESNYDNNVTEVQVEVDSPLGVIHRPDGRWIEGTPMRASRVGPDVRIEHDVVPCPATNYQVFFSLGPPGDYAYDGEVCSIGPSGDSTVSLPDPDPGGLLWFVVVGTKRDTPNLFLREGGHGFDSEGIARPASGFGRCQVFQAEQSVTCAD